MDLKQNQSSHKTYNDKNLIIRLDSWEVIHGMVGQIYPQIPF